MAYTWKLAVVVASKIAETLNDVIWAFFIFCSRTPPVEPLAQLLQPKFTV